MFLSQKRDSFGPFQEAMEDPELVDGGSRLRVSVGQALHDPQAETEVALKRDPLKYCLSKKNPTSERL